jgi:hypothetical protein
MIRPLLAILNAIFLRQSLIKGSFGQAYFRIYASFYPIATYMAARPYKKKKKGLLKPLPIFERQ